MFTKIQDFIKDSVDEMRTKVSWPTYRQLQSSSMLVLIASLIFALLIGLIDLAFDNSLSWYYNQF